MCCRSAGACGLTNASDEAHGATSGRIIVQARSTFEQPRGRRSQVNPDGRRCVHDVALPRGFSATDVGTGASAGPSQA